MSSVVQVSAALKSTTAPGLTGGSDVWRLEGTNAQTEALRESLLSLAADFAIVYVHYDDEPPAGGALATAIAVTPFVWRIPRGVPGRELAEWLYMGNWQLYARNQPLERIPDLCRADDPMVKGFVRDSGVSLIIDSFHDDNFWTIGIGADRA